jgi:hypothetical protein
MPAEMEWVPLQTFHLPSISSGATPKWKRRYVHSMSATWLPLMQVPLAHLIPLNVRSRQRADCPSTLLCSTTILLCDLYTQPSHPTSLPLLRLRLHLHLPPRPALRRDSGGTGARTRLLLRGSAPAQVSPRQLWIPALSARGRSAVGRQFARVHSAMRRVWPILRASLHGGAGL